MSLASPTGCGDAIRSGKLKQLTYLGHSGKHAVATGQEQPLGMTVTAMTSTTETNNLHTSSPRGSDPVNAVLHHEAVGRSDLQLLGRVKEEIGGRLTAFDHERAKHVRVK